MFRHDSTRTVYMRDMHTQACALYFNTVPGARVYLEDAACTIGRKDRYEEVPCFHFTGQEVWCHSLNPERSRYETINDGGLLWIFGFKVEGGGMLNITRNGGTTEILGGTVSVGNGSDDPVVLNDHSRVSAIYSTNGYHDGSVYPVAVRELRDGRTGEIKGADCPMRMWPFHLMPLYSSETEEVER